MLQSRERTRDGRYNTVLEKQTKQVYMNREENIGKMKSDLPRTRLYESVTPEDAVALTPQVLRRACGPATSFHPRLTSPTTTSFGVTFDVVHVGHARERIAVDR